MTTRHVDGRLSARAQDQIHPRALVIKEISDQGVESWWLERRGEDDRTGLGRHFGEANRALSAIIAAEED